MVNTWNSNLNVHIHIKRYAKSGINSANVKYRNSSSSIILEDLHCEQNIC